jgi:glycosyltransferase involved in cell wall biosynthesis
MKVLLVSGIYRPEIGGPATYIPTLAQALTNRSNSVEVVTLKNSSSTPTIENWAVNYIQRDQALPFRFIKTFWLIYKKAKNSDVIFANGLHQETALALIFLKKRSVAKVVGDPVFERASNKGLTNSSIYDFNRGNLNLNFRMQRLFIRWSLNRFDVITCPSREIMDRVEGWGVSKPIQFIPNGVAPIKEKHHEKNFEIITVSRLIALKNIDKLIYACASTNRTLAVVGSGPEEARLVSLAKSLGAKVTFFGQLGESDVINTLQKSKVFALLSDYEGLSFALLQAMAVGLPSIVSNVKGNSDVITDGKEGFLVNINEKDSIESAIESLLNSKKRITDFGRAAINKVQNDYSLETQISKVIALMSSEK